MIRLLQIDYFLEVAEQLNITDAAKKLYISQPALSKQIALLEQELGTKLFERKARKLKLTFAGEQLQEDLKDIRIRLDKAFEKAAATGKEQIRPIRIGCFDGRVTDDYLPGIVRKLHEYDPEIPTMLSMHEMEEVLRKLREGSVDIAFTLDDDYIPEAGYSYSKIFNRKTGIVYSPDLFSKPWEEITVEDFKKKKLLISKTMKGHRLSQRQRDHAFELGLDGNNCIENENIGTLMMNLTMAKGYAIMSADIGRQSKNIRTIPLDDEYDTWIVGIVKDTNVYAKEIFEKVFLQKTEK